jgi:hypothetical protein
VQYFCDLPTTAVVAGATCGVIRQRAARAGHTTGDRSVGAASFSKEEVGMAMTIHHGLGERMWRAAILDTNDYEEVEADRNATPQALLVVVIAAIANIIGLVIGGGGEGGVLTGLVSAVVGWVVWSLVAYAIGTGLFGGTATPGELLRTLGFAQSPRILNLFSFIPIVGGIIRLVVFFWLLVAGIVAIRQALDFSTGRAIATAIVGWICMVVIDVVLALVTHSFAGLGGMLH